MSTVLNDPSLWSLIDTNYVISYVIVAASTALAYDWALTFGQEFELIWRQRWSLMTVLYLGLRCAGILYSIINILLSLPAISVTDAGCTNLVLFQTWICLVVNTMLGVIIITQLHAMYPQSRTMFICLVVSFLVVTITCGVMTAMESSILSFKEFIFYDTYHCINGGNVPSVQALTWILGTAWEIFALSLSVWIAVKHFRKFQRWATEDRLLALIKIQVFYSATFVVATSFNLRSIFSESPIRSNSSPVETDFYFGIGEIALLVRMFMLGPRLILSVREHNAKLVAKSDTGPGIQLLSRSAYHTSPRHVN